MCKSHNPRKIDKCMETIVKTLSWVLKDKFSVVACCCGHGKYPMTLVMDDKFNNRRLEMFSATPIPRKKRFYRKDKQGYYYIPEVLKLKER